MKLKLFNLFTALLIATYVFSTIGISVIEHYCGGELEEISVFSKPKSCCAEDDSTNDLAMNNEDGCCKNKTSHLVFHKDFTIKILYKKNVAVYKDTTPILLYADFTKPLYYSIQDKHNFIFPKIPPPKLVQQCIVECSVMRI